MLRVARLCWDAAQLLEPQTYSSTVFLEVAGKLSHQVQVVFFQCPVVIILALPLAAQVV
jgi:hypothetical protein